MSPSLRFSTARVLVRPLFAGLCCLVGLGLTGACGDDSAAGGGGADGGEGLSNPGRICIDRTTLLGVPPAGIKVGFRVLDASGDPVRPLRTGPDGDVVIINDEKGTPFGQGSEGDAVSDVGTASDVELYSVLVLDMSDSIFNNGVQDDVIAGADAYVTEVVANAPPEYRHQVAIVAFGRPELVDVVQDFTSDISLLRTTLQSLATESRGSTDLYNAYLLGLELADNIGSPDAVVERFVVMISDGTHEAGAEGYLRELALAAKDDSLANKYTIGIRGTYDACKLEELAGAPESCAGELVGCREGITCDPGAAPPPSCTQFLSDVDPSQLAETFKRIAERAAGIARSNYEIGVCTPVALGNSSMTLRVNVGGAEASETLPYSTQLFGLNGAVNLCNPQEVKNAEPPGTGGGGQGGNGQGGGGGNGQGGGAQGGGGQGGGT